jgi:hypothetical protein
MQWTTSALESLPELAVFLTGDPGHAACGTLVVAFVA